MAEPNENEEKLLDQSELNALVKELRETVESKNADSAEAKEKIAKIEEKLNAQEDSNQKLVTELAIAKQKEEELESKHKDLERQLYMTPNALSKEQKSEQMKAMEKFITQGKEVLSSEERKYLRTDNNVAGGFLAPPEFVTEITKPITETSPIRALATVRTTSSPKMEIPRRTSLVQVRYEGEGKKTDPNNSTYGRDNLKLNRCSAVTEITLEELTLTPFNMQQEINSDISEAYAQKEGLVFLKGTGDGEPEGIMTNPDVPQFASGIADDVQLDSVIKMTGEVKTGYNPSYGLNRRTLAHLRTEKSDDGAFLWVVGNIAAGIPNQLNGYSYTELPDMDDISADNYPIIFGDFKRGYLIGDHTVMIVQRDDNTLADEGKVRFIFHRWNSGAVILAEAFVKLKVATSV
jgi:HK97 family phage major capsid protein